MGVELLSSFVRVPATVEDARDMVSSGLAAVSEVPYRLFAALPFRAFSSSLPLVATACFGMLAGSFFYLRYRQSVHLEALKTAQKTQTAAIQEFGPLRTKILNGGLLTEEDRRSPAFLILKNALKPSHLNSAEDDMISQVSIQISYVLFGIKPAYEFGCPASYEVLPATIKKVCELNPSCHFYERRKDDLNFYILINASPIPLFDPAKYLKQYMNYEDSLPILNNYKLGDRMWQQQMAYVVGYGPSWEAFCERTAAPATAQDGRPMEQAGEPPATTEEDIFSDEHYRQLGLATHPDYPDKAIQNGRAYSQTFRETLKKNPNLSPTAQQQSRELEEEMDHFSMHFFANEIVAKTPYFKTYVLYASRVKQAFDSYVNQDWVAEITKGLDS